jgi:hypothetical protein
MKPLMRLLMKPLAIPLCHQKTVAKRLVIAILLIKLLAIPLGCQPKNFWPGTRKTTTKWLVITQQNTLGKSLMKQLAISLRQQAAK